jgi:hypothetical protein
MKKIVESYKRKLATEDGWVLKRGAQLRIALCYPNTYAIGMANLGFQAMYELFNNIPEVSCERVFLPDTSRAKKGSSGYDALPHGRTSDTIDELGEYVRTRTPLLSLESQAPVREFDVIAFSISFETDYVNMARMLQMSGVPVWSKDRTKHDPLIVMGGASSFLNPEPIADFTDVIGVGEGEILGPKIVDAILEHETKEEVLLALAQQGRMKSATTQMRRSRRMFPSLQASRREWVGRFLPRTRKKAVCDGRFENNNSISPRNSVVMKSSPRQRPSLRRKRRWAIAF